MSDSKAILWRTTPGKEYCHLVPAHNPSVGYHNDGCRSITVELAENATRAVQENERLKEINTELLAACDYLISQVYAGVLTIEELKPEYGDSPLTALQVIEVAVAKAKEA